MNKTTVYLPDAVVAAIKREAARNGRSEAQVIRDALSASLDLATRRPQGGLFASGGPSIAERVDEELAEGFGEW